MAEDMAHKLMQALLTYAETDDTVFVGGHVRGLQLDGYFDMERLSAILEAPQHGQDND